ncbi:MAG TPA: DegT/DnrJ/EryC1/StrS family aminotransferase [Candidatus Dormibacteraeota bacterium]
MAKQTTQAHHQTESSSSPLIPLSRPWIGPEEKAAVIEVLESGMLAQGPRVAALEEAFTSVTGARHAIATSSGTTGLHLALLAHGVGPGDEVITSPFTFIASVNAILFTGAKPVFADIDEATFNIDPARLEAAITPRTKAVMPVHIYGQPCDMDEISAMAQRRGVILLEDAAQAVGATYRGRHVGTFGTAVFSLYATKNVMTGEGGMITTESDEVADRARLLRNHGMRNRYEYEMLGYNFRLTDLLAAIGIVQLGRLEETTRRRRSNADYLNAHLRGVRTPVVKEGRDHAWHQYTVMLPKGVDRSDVVRRLSAAGIGTGVFYPLGAHRFPHIQAETGDVDLPVTDRVAASVLSLPVHPLLEPSDLERITAAVNSL